MPRAANRKGTLLPVQSRLDYYCGTVSPHLDSGSLDIRPYLLLTSQPMAVPRHIHLRPLIVGARADQGTEYCSLLRIA
jgi:hypothetical protein